MVVRKGFYKNTGVDFVFTEVRKIRVKYKTKSHLFGGDFRWTTEYWKVVIDPKDGSIQSAGYD